MKQKPERILVVGFKAMDYEAGSNTKLDPGWRVRIWGFRVLFGLFTAKPSPHFTIARMASTFVTAACTSSDCFNGGNV